MYLYICVYMCIYVYVYVCVYIYIYIWTCNDSDYERGVGIPKKPLIIKLVDE